jgi:hypothetical protein
MACCTPLTASPCVACSCCSALRLATTTTTTTPRAYAAPIAAAPSSSSAVCRPTNATHASSSSPPHADHPSHSTWEAEHDPRPSSHPRRMDRCVHRRHRCAQPPSRFPMRHRHPRCAAVAHRAARAPDCPHALGPTAPRRQIPIGHARACSTRVSAPAAPHSLRSLRHVTAETLFRYPALRSSCNARLCGRSRRWNFGPPRADELP